MKDGIGYDYGTLPELNEPLLRKTMEHIHDLPQFCGSVDSHDPVETDSWYQGAYRYVRKDRCKSAMCVAGWACELDGGQWLYATLDDAYKAGYGPDALDLLVPEPGDHTSRDMMTRYHASNGAVQAFQRAKRILGLTQTEAGELFSGGNRMKTIDGLVEKIIASRGL